MRRSDRQVTDHCEICSILDACKVCRLGLSEGTSVYIVPMNFGYEFIDGSLVLYFHSAKVGHKLELLSVNPEVGFEMDTNHALVEGVRACEYSYRYASIIGNGIGQVLQQPAEKLHAMQVLMTHQTGKQFVLEARELEAVTIFRVVASTFDCKRRI